jgi:hypothetical protein
MRPTASVFNCDFVLYSFLAPFPSLDTVLLDSLLGDVTVEIDREVLSTLCILVDPNSNILTRAFEGTIAFLVYGDPSLLPT